MPMAHGLSLDLRRRVVAFVEAGHSRRAVGRPFKVAESAAIKRVRRVAATALASATLVSARGK